MARSKLDREATTDVPLRLRVPAALAVALVGASATVAMSFAGCQEESMPDPVDAGPIEKTRDAGGIDAGSGDDGAGDDAPVADAGASPVDAYVPPDVPDH